MRFASPLWFLLLLLWAPAVYAVMARRRREGILFAPLAALPHLSFSWRIYLRALLPPVFMLGLLLLIIALARPQKMFARVTRTTDAVAIQLVMDISGSMEALDFSRGQQYRSRLDVVKATMLNFIEHRPDDLIGLVTFGGFAVSLVPLTLDHEALARVLKAVTVPRPRFDKQGQVVNEEEMMTAIGDALAVGSARLEQTDIKSRVLVLLSDGESNAGLIQPDAAMKAAKTLGIKIYTIGVGSSGPAPFRARDMFGREVIQQAYVSMDEALLQRLADGTGGVYYNVRDPQALKQAFDAIDRLERTTIKTETFSRRDELFAWWLGSGLILIVLAWTGNMVLARRVI